MYTFIYVFVRIYMYIYETPPPRKKSPPPTILIHKRRPADVLLHYQQICGVCCRRNCGRPVRAQKPVNFM